MTYLPSLIKKIDDFYKLTESFTLLKRMAQQSTWTMPDDPEEEETESQEDAGGLYSSIMGAANSISNEGNDFKNEDVANELLLIADLYRKVLEINGGYAALNNAIRVALANIDSMIDDSDGTIGEDVREIAEDTLEEAAGDIRRRAKAATNPMDEAKATQILRSVKQNFNQQEARQEMESQKSVYEKGKPGAETGHGIAARPTPETPQKYSNEIRNLSESLENATDPNNRKDIVELAQTLDQIIKQMKEVARVQDEWKLTPDDTTKQEEFNVAVAKLNELRTKRRLLKNKLNKFLLETEKSRLMSQLAAVPNSKPQEKEWLQQKIRLLDLRLDDRLLRKRDEIKARKALVNSLGIIDEHDDFVPLNIPVDERERFNSAIEQGRNQTLSKSDYDRTRTEQKGKEQGRDYVPTGAAQRGGARQKLLKEMDFDKAAFPGMLKKLRDLNNTATADARKYIMRAKEGGDPELEPYVDAVSAAIRKKDNAAKYKAINALKEKISSKIKESSLKGYLQVLRLSPHFKKIEESLYTLKNKQDENGNWNLNEDDKKLLTATITDIDRIITIYSTYYQKEGARKRNEQPYPFFKGVVGTLLFIKEYINKTLAIGENNG